MGLGKICQVFPSLAHLKERNVKGPHLIVVPASTLENWLQEFQVISPQLQVMPYYADQEGRELVRKEIVEKTENNSVNVIVTTYLWHGQTAVGTTVMALGLSAMEGAGLFILVPRR